MIERLDPLKGKEFSRPDLLASVDGYAGSGGSLVDKWISYDCSLINLISLLMNKDSPSKSRACHSKLTHIGKWTRLPFSPNGQVSWSWSFCPILRSWSGTSVAEEAMVSLSVALVDLPWIWERRHILCSYGTLFISFMRKELKKRFQNSIIPRSGQKWLDQDKVDTMYKVTQPQRKRAKVAGGVEEEVVKAAPWPFVRSAFKPAPEDSFSSDNLEQLTD